jgi:hypothetical protein
MTIPYLASDHQKSGRDGVRVAPFGGRQTSVKPPLIRV